MLCKPALYYVDKSRILIIHSPNAKLSVFLQLSKTASIYCYHSKLGTVQAHKKSKKGSHNRDFFLPGPDARAKFTHHCNQNKNKIQTNKPVILKRGLLSCKLPLSYWGILSSLPEISFHQVTGIPVLTAVFQMALVYLLESQTQKGCDEQILAACKRQVWRTHIQHTLNIVKVLSNPALF